VSRRLTDDLDRTLDGKATIDWRTKGLSTELDGRFARIIVEKPFGHDLATAVALNEQLREGFDERQVFRIDHYLGKETVQNILALRFANGLFEPIWNRDHIDHVQITVAETLAVGRRGKFYDATGALRDMVPNHLFQLLALTAMEPPSRFDATAVRRAKAAVLDEIQVESTTEALRRSVRGQYAAGRVGDTDLAALAMAAAAETFTVRAVCGFGFGRDLPDGMVPLDPLLDPVADDLASLALDVLVDEQGFARSGPNLLFHPGSG